MRFGRSSTSRKDRSEQVARWWVDDMQDLEAFISFFDLSSDKIAEDVLEADLAERPELLNDIDLSTGEKRSGLA